MEHFDFSWLVEENELFLIFVSITKRIVFPIYSPDVILCGWLGLKHQLTN